MAPSYLPPFCVNFFYIFEHKMKMGSTNTLWFVLVLMLVGFSSSDINQERAECADKLIELSPCMTYVGGQAKAPTPDCCSGFKQVVRKSKKCLCILIKDKDDPTLELKINVTLAATLPSTCHAPANVTACIDLLHLDPDSAEAKVFKGYANMTTMTNPGNSTGIQGEIKSGGRRKGISLALKMVCGYGSLIWLLTSHVMM